ncbi:hypothetical protein Tco_0469638 [Tanacetum coccineum]
MPSIILDDECLISKDLSKALLGRVKEFASLPNLKIETHKTPTNFKELKVLMQIKIQVYGEIWVLLEFPSSFKTKELFQENMGVGSWFSVLKQASTDFIPEGRIVWVEIEGVPFKLCRVPGWVPKFVDDSDDDDESDDGFKDGVLKFKGGVAGREDNLCLVDSSGKTVFEESLEQKETQSEDPFGIYSLFNKNKDKSENMKPSDHSLKYPPGFSN